MDFTKHTFEFSLLSKDGNTKELNIENIEDRDEAYQQMRSVFCDENNLTVTEFEKRYDLKSERHKISFNNPPWDDGKELESDLINMEEVSHLTFIPPLTGSYGPPRFLVRTQEDFQSIEESVKEYYGGLEVKKKGESIFIIVSPTTSESEN